MPKEELQQHAQGRVWSGKRALQNGLIDGLGGIDRAIGIAKQAAGIGRLIKNALSCQTIMFYHVKHNLHVMSGNADKQAVHGLDEALVKRNLSARSIDCSVLC